MTVWALWCRGKGALGSASAYLPLQRLLRLVCTHVCVSGLRGSTSGHFVQLAVAFDPSWTPACLSNDHADDIPDYQYSPLSHIHDADDYVDVDDEDDEIGQLEYDSADGSVRRGPALAVIDHFLSCAGSSSLENALKHLVVPVHWWATPRLLLDHLLSRSLRAYDRERTLQLLSVWSRRYPHDWCRQMRSRLNAELAEGPTAGEIPSLSPSESLAAAKQATWCIWLSQRLRPRSLFAALDRNVVKKIIDYVLSDYPQCESWFWMLQALERDSDQLFQFDLDQMSPQILATSIDNILRYHHSRLNLRRESRHAYWIDKTRQRECPELMARLNLFRGLVALIADQIVARRDLLRRVALVRKLVGVGLLLVQSHNYEGALAVNAGLADTSVSRLRRTWSCVGMRRQLERLTEACSSARSYRALRAMTEENAARCCPYLGFSLTNLLYLKQSHYVGHPAELSVNYLAKLAEELERFEACGRQLHAAPPPPVDPLCAALMAACIENAEKSTKEAAEAARYAKSLMLEPRTVRTQLQ